MKTKKELLTISRLCRVCEAEFQIDPRNMYCSVTGRQIGRFDESVFQDLVLEAQRANDDESNAIEDLMTRTLSAMRPSPAWNMPDRDLLKRFMKSRPAETLSYLMTRLHEPGPQLKMDYFTRLTIMAERIRVYRLMEGLTEARDTSELIFILIDIDALYNLNTMSIPANMGDLSLTIAELITRPENEAWESFMVHWRGWHGRLIADYEKRQKAALTQEQWLKGNTMARSARSSLYQDLRPKSEATIKREVKTAMDNELTNLLRAIMESSMEVAEHLEPVKAKPVAGLFKPGSIKFGAPIAQQGG